MEKLKYIISLSFKNLFRFKLINFTIFLSCVISFTIISVYFSNMTGWLENSKDIHTFKDKENIKLIEVSFELEDAFKKDEPFMLENGAFRKMAKQNRIYFKDKFIYNSRLYVISSNYINMYNNFLYSGNKITNIENECIISYTLSDKYNISLGDEIGIGTSIFKVVGISNEKTYNNILICNDKVIENYIYPKLYYTFENIDNLKTKNNFILGAENINNINKAPLSTYIMSMFIIFIMLVYSVLSIINIVLFYKEKVKNSMNIQKFLGAKTKYIFLQRFIENSILLILSCIPSYFISKYISKYINNLSGSHFVVNYIGFIFLLIIVVSISLLFSFFASKKKRGEL